MLKAIETTCIVKPLRRESIGSIWTVDIGKPTTWGSVTSSGLPWLTEGMEVLHLPWAKLILDGASVLWQLAERAIVAYRVPGESWRMVAGWLLVECDEATEHMEGRLVVLDSKPHADEAQQGTAMTGRWARRRIVWRVDNERVVTIRAAGKEWQVIGEGQVLGVMLPETCAECGRYEETDSGLVGEYHGNYLCLEADRRKIGEWDGVLKYYDTQRLRPSWCPLGCVKTDTGGVGHAKRGMGGGVGGRRPPLGSA